MPLCVCLCCRVAEGRSQVKVPTYLSDTTLAYLSLPTCPADFRGGKESQSGTRESCTGEYIRCVSLSPYPSQSTGYFLASCRFSIWAAIFLLPPSPILFPPPCPVL